MFTLVLCSDVILLFYDFNKRSSTESSIRDDDVGGIPKHPGAALEDSWIEECWYVLNIFFGILYITL
ncbi:unnamed protein product [Hermetia illucens]|uniref:Uncharacterized protein n=1 Tax=Hermetia illucens TaxID=343691 RepID=A0A7R8UGW2_HERIL|nr:unnamed protein product [Hermetia illucens]